MVVTMETEDFKQTWLQLYRERAQLLDKRTILENELIEVGNKIVHLNEVINHLAPLSGLNYEEGVGSLGMTDAVRHILKVSQERLSAKDVSRELSEKGFDLSKLSAPMASIYKVLSRLVDEYGEVEREKDDDGKVFYKWKISEDDIPF